jgi:proteic killer suppression protein
MIRSFRSRTLKLFFEKGDGSRLHGPLDRIRRVLGNVDAARSPDELDIPGYHFHQLGGNRRGTYSVRITGNWRITFEWEGEDAIRVDYEDYH